MAKERAGLDDLLFGVAIVSTLLAVNDVLNKKKSLEQAKASYEKIAKIDAGVRAINAKLAG